MTGIIILAICLGATLAFMLEDWSDGTKMQWHFAACAIYCSGAIIYLLIKL